MGGVKRRGRLTPDCLLASVNETLIRDKRAVTSGLDGDYYYIGVPILVRATAMSV
jgi:hypothetical protein